MSGAISTQEYLRGIALKAKNEQVLMKGVHDVGVRIDDCLTLRRCRLLYSMILGRVIPSEFPAEMLGYTFNGMYPMYQVAASLGCLVGSEDDGEFRYYSTWRPLTPETLSSGLVSWSDLSTIPWAFMPVTRYKMSASGDMTDPFHNIMPEVVQLSMCKVRRDPITVFTYDATCDCTNKGRSSYYTAAYQGMLPMGVQTGFHGVLHMNQLVNLNLPSSGGNTNIEARRVTDDQYYFLCMGCTSHSIEAGLMRRTAHGTTIRLWTCRDWVGFCTVLSNCIQLCQQSEYFLSVEGNWSFITQDCYYDMCKRYLSGELRLSTMHHYTMELRGITLKCLNISVMPGVLIRKVGARCIDSLCSMYCVVAGIGTNSFPAIPPNLVINSMSTYFLTVPFLRYNRPPRTLISAVQSIQSICSPHLLTSSVYVPNNVSDPLVVTDFVSSKLNGCMTIIPGENVRIALLNLNDNYEDCFIVSRACVDRGTFSYTETMTIIVDTSDSVKVGDTITMETHSWWCIPFPALVTQQTYDIKQRLMLTLVRTAKLTDGDKLATPHGQKGVALIKECSDMQYGMDNDGNRVDFDIIIAMASVVSRLTVGQVLELCAGRLAMQLGRPVTDTEFIKHLHDTGKGLCDTDPLTVFDNDSNEPLLRLNSDGSLSPVQCEWGYGRVSLLHHLTTNKHHFTRIKSNEGTKYSASGRARGGSVKVGDMETHALLSSGLSVSIQELAMRRDMSKLVVCCWCNRQCLLCDCEVDKHETRVALVPYSTVCFDIINSVTELRSFEYLADYIGH